VERRQLDHLDTPGIQESVGPDEQDIGPIAPDVLEGGIDLAAGAGAANADGERTITYCLFCCLFAPTL
jgi:hypothetical protein